MASKGNPRRLGYLQEVTTPRGPRTLATWEDLVRMATNGTAAEIVDGAIVEKAAPTAEHGSAQFALASAIGAFGKRGGDGEGGGPGGWWLMTEVEVEYEPHQIFRHDLLGHRRDRMAERPSGQPLRTRPDWACEVLSPSTASRDLVRKLQVLSDHAVPHYWIVDPANRTLTVLRWTPEGYLTALTASALDRVRAEPFDAIEIELADVLAPP